MNKKKEVKRTVDWTEVNNMRTKGEIMKDALDKGNFDTLRDKHSYLKVELLCDMREDQVNHNAAMEEFSYIYKKGEFKCH